VGADVCRARVGTRRRCAQLAGPRPDVRPPPAQYGGDEGRRRQTTSSSSKSRTRGLKRWWPIIRSRSRAEGVIEGKLVSPSLRARRSRSRCSKTGSVSRSGGSKRADMPLSTGRSIAPRVNQCLRRRRGGARAPRRRPEALHKRRQTSRSRLPARAKQTTDLMQT
jgi:hypothetical protein